MNEDPFLETELPINKIDNSQWLLFCEEMIGRLETLKYDTEGNSHQKSYNEAIRHAQEQIY